LLQLLYWFYICAFRTFFKVVSTTRLVINIFHSIRKCHYRLRFIDMSNFFLNRSNRDVLKILLFGTYLREWRFRLRGLRTLDLLVWSASSSHRRTCWSVPNPIPWSLVPRPIGKWTAGLGRDCKNVIKKNLIKICKLCTF